MRLVLITAILLPVMALSQSKKSLPSFGKIDKEDLLLKTCEFDKDAEAEVLYENGRFYVDINGSEPYLELQHHVRIKILTDKGLDRANIKLRYVSRLNSQAILNLTASTYNLDASGNVAVTKLDKKQVIQKKINSVFSEQVFSMPEVKVGSVIEYKYTLRGYNQRNWNLQSSIPVRFSRFEVDFPSMFEVHTRSLCTLPAIAKDESTTMRTIKTFSMQNIPALRDERYISSENDYLQRIESWVVAYTIEGRRWPLLKTWQQIAKSLIEDEDLGLQLKKEIPRTADLDMELKKFADPYKKMVVIHNYVRKNMSWDGTDNFWALSGVKSAWKEKVGTSGEINLILINLLRDAGLKVDPIMISTRDHGRLVPLFPDVSQFNKVLAFVTIEDKNYVLDGTDKYTPAGLVPQDVMFTEGMILDPTNQYGFRFQTLWDEKRVDRNTVFLRAQITDKGEMAGHVSISSADYARIKRVPEITDKEKFINHYFKAGHSSLICDSLKYKNEEIDTLPLIQEFDFREPVNSSGEYAYFNINLFNSMGANPFIADNRFSDVFFGTNQSHQIIGNFTIPEGYMLEELPKNIRMTLEDQSLVVTRMMSAAGNLLNTRITIEFKKPFYTPEEYPDLKEFYKKMYSLLDEQVVIKKKS